MTPHILYITYDGLLDPLGKSQILPYLYGLKAKGCEIHILSVEKIFRLESDAGKLNVELSSAGIKWDYINFRESHLGKINDMRSFTDATHKIIRANTFDLIHARSYVAGNVALKMFRQFNIPYIFDIRGFWIEERIENGIWNLKNPVRYLAYKYFKKKEKFIYKSASRIVALTHSSKKIIIDKWGLEDDAIDVIPCAADFEIFKPLPEEIKNKIRNRFGIKPDDLVLTYLGSIGGTYMLGEMLEYYQKLKVKYPNAWFIFITSENETRIITECERREISTEKIIVKYSDRTEINDLINTSDLNIIFRKESYSTLASMPTKLGEVWAAGIPVIANRISDFPEYFIHNVNGHLIENPAKLEFDSSINTIENLLSVKPDEIRTTAERYFKLKNAVEAYYKSYLLTLGYETK